MTNIKKIFAITIIVILAVACSDEEQKENNLVVNRTKIEYNKASVYNPNNPYDVYAEGIESFYLALKTTLVNMDKDTPYSVYEDNVNEIIGSLNPIYPAVNLSNYSGEDTIFIKDFMSNYMKDISSNGIVKASLNAENTLLAMEKGDLQNDLLCFTSQIKYSFYYLDEIIIYYAPNYEERHNNCIGNHLNDISNDNVIAQTAFFVGLPESFLWIVAECAYMAAFEPNHPYCQNNWMS